MSRTNIMKHLFGALCVAFAATTPAWSQLPNQPALEPVATDTDHGVYSVTDQSLNGNDPNAAIAYDNFSLSDPYDLSGITWTGIYAEPLPGARSRRDFIISIFGDNGGAPAVGAGPVLSWSLDGGFAGGSGADVMAVPNGDVNSPTATTPGNGPGFDYSAAISGTLAAGDYWVSIQADQLFDNIAPIVDPEWQWHTGLGPDDGFYLEDLAINQELVRITSKDLAFGIEGSVVPEPSAMLLGLFGFLTIGMVRRKRAA